MDLKVYHNPGDIVFTGYKMTKEYLDQLSEDIIYIKYNKLTKYLRDKYNLSQEEYYNLVVHGDKDFKHYCKCEGCNNEVRFKGLFSNQEGYYNCCSRKCNGAYVANLLKSEGRLIMMTPEFRKIAVATIQKMHDEGKHPFGTVEVHARSRMTDFIRKSKSRGREIAYLYVSFCTHTNELFKIGVTCDINNYHGMMNLHRLKGMRQLASGSVEYIADIEYKVKLHFNQREEYYPLERMDDVMNFIKSIL